MYDLNKTSDTDFSPIPPGIYRVKAKLRPGGVGEEELLRLAKNLRTQMLDLQLTVVGGKYSGRKVFELVTVFADLGNSPEPAPIDERQADNYKRAVNMGLAKLRRILESAHEIAHDDEGKEAQTILRFNSLQVFDNLEFWADIDIKEAANGFRERNVVARVLTPDMSDWPGASPKRPPLGDEMDDSISV
jgi:hypothetical protein